MSVTYGFYNSLNGDRKYDASAISSIFDGLIVDGVFASIGTAFAVKATTGLTVNVGIGKAWFNHTWTLNDAILPIDVPEAEVLLNRIDAVVLEVNATEAVRANSIKVITGTPGSSPARPTLIKDGGVYQYPLCFINRKFGTSSVTQADIVNMVGSDETPFVTGLLRTISLNELLGQWEDEMNQFLDDRKAIVNAWVNQQETDFTSWSDAQRAAFDTWRNNHETSFTNWSDVQKNAITQWTAQQKSAFDTWSDTQRTEITTWINTLKSDLTAEQTVLDAWMASEQSDFLTWYNDIKGTLSGDVAGNLQLQLDKDALRQTLLTGFDDGEKTFSDDGTEIVSTASDGRTITKTFTENFSVATTVLKSAQGAVQAQMVKRFAADGKTISTTVTYS